METEKRGLPPLLIMFFFDTKNQFEYPFQHFRTPNDHNLHTDSSLSKTKNSQYNQHQRQNSNQPFGRANKGNDHPHAKGGKAFTAPKLFSVHSPASLHHHPMQTEERSDKKGQEIFPDTRWI